MTKRGMAYVMSKPDGVSHVDVQIPPVFDEALTYGRSDSCHVEHVFDACAHVVVLGRKEHLRLVLESAECGAVDDRRLVAEVVSAHVFLAFVCPFSVNRTVQWVACHMPS